MWPNYPPSPYQTDINLSDWGWLFDYPGEAAMPWAGTPGPAYSALGPPYGYSPYWNEDTRFPYTPAPSVGYTQPMGGQTQMGAPPSTLFGPSRRYPSMGISQRGPSVWGGQAAGGGGGGFGAPQATYPWTTRAWNTATGLPSAMGAAVGGWMNPPAGQALEGLGAFQAGYSPGDAQEGWNVFTGAQPIPGAEGPGRFLTPEEIAGMTPEQRAAMAASDAGVQQQMAQYNQQVQQQVQQQATPGQQGFDQSWWDEFTKVHGETPQEYYSRPEHERGAGGWQQAVARDASYGQQYMAMTGKTSLTDEDWRNIYYRVLPGGGGGGGGGGEVAAAAAPKYQVPAMRYSGPQTSLTMPSGALGTIGAVGRQAVEDILRSRGWSPSGVMGKWGYSEYTREAPRRVWFGQKLFKGRGGKQAEKLFRKLEWTPKKKKK